MKIEEKAVTRYIGASGKEYDNRVSETYSLVEDAISDILYEASDRSNGIDVGWMARVIMADREKVVALLAEVDAAVERDASS